MLFGLSIIQSKYESALMYIKLAKFKTNKQLIIS